MLHRILFTDYKLKKNTRHKLHKDNTMKRKKRTLKFNIYTNISIFPSE